MTTIVQLVGASGTEGDGENVPIFLNNAMDLH